MSNTMTSLMVRLVILMTGVCVGIGVSLAASFGTFEMIVTVFLSTITWLLANYLGYWE